MPYYDHLLISVINSDGPCLTRRIHANILVVKAIDSEEIEALEKFKQMHHINTASTQNDLQILQGKQKDLEIDLQQQQKHLIEALLAKDKLAKELEALKGGTSALDALNQVSPSVSLRSRSPIDDGEEKRQQNPMQQKNMDDDLDAELEAIGMRRGCVLA